MNSMKNDLNYYITKFFLEYLPSIKGVSKNTTLSYRDTFVLLLEYLKSKKKININKLSFDNIDESLIEEFLNYLEIERKNSISTRNQRLAAIHSFYRYLQRRELSCFDLCSRILSIPNKKAPTKTLSYFSTDEITILINSPNTRNKDGFRDYVLLLFMYETAARAQEIADLRTKQLFLQRDSSFAILIGKGNKERKVPLGDELSKVLTKYIKTFYLEADNFVFQNKWNEQLTTKGIEYILKKYIQKSQKNNPDKFKENYSNHSMRHSRAMHLLEAGVNLIYIRDILGHTSVVTTEIYAKTNPKIKEKQILEHSKTLNTKERYSESKKKELLDFLKNL